MKMNSKIAKTPDELKAVEYKRMKALMKKELSRLEKNTSAEKPTQVILIGEHAYPDKPTGIGLMLFGGWKGAFKDYAKKEIGTQDALGAIGQAYYAGVGSDGQKIVRIDLAKGKAKGKTDKLAKGLRKLVPQATYNLVFGEMSEDALNGLESRLDAAPEVEEVFEEPELEDEGESDPQDLDGLDLNALFDSNLRELSEAVKTISTEIYPRIKAQNSTADDADFLIDTLDLANEWMELYREADAAVRDTPANIDKKIKVENITQQVNEALALLSNRGVQPTKTAASAANPTPQTYDTAYRAVDIGKELHKNSKYWTKVELKNGTEKVVSQQEYLQLKAAGQIEQVITTWCNQLAYELSGQLLGENSPFNLLPMGKGWTNANTLYRFMEQANGTIVDEVVGEGRYAKAWEAINSGKMVYFCSYNTKGSGHVATGIPTPTLRTNKTLNDKVGRITQAGTQVGEFWIDEIWGSNGLKSVKIFVGRLNAPLPAGEKQDPNLLLAIYKTITAPVGKGKTPAGGISKLSGKYNAVDLQQIIANIKCVQQLLINSGDLAGKADGDCGDKTVAAIQAAQAKAGAEPTGFITYGDATWNYLMGISAPKIEAAKAKTLGVQPAPALDPAAIQFQYAGSAKPMSAKAEQVLRDILAKAGEPKALITSTLRSAAEQATVMYNNIVRDGAKKNRKAYKNPAMAAVVVDAFEKAQSEGKSAADIQQAVLLAVNQVGAANLSAHCNASNPAVDIHPASLKNRGYFEMVLKADARVSAICPPKDPFYHIEVK